MDYRAKTTYFDWNQNCTIEREFNIRIVEAHRDSPGYVAFLFPNGTGALLHPRAALAFAEGRTISVRTDRLYYAVRADIVPPAVTEEVPEAPEEDVGDVGAEKDS